MYSGGDNYSPMYIIFEFEVLEGEITLNQVAYENRNKIMDIGENDAPYTDEGAFKGISNTPNEVVADFSYDIKGNETYIPIRTFNLNNPLGYTSAFWQTHVNPQQNFWSQEININEQIYSYRVRDITTETEALKFRYTDNNKLNRYSDDYDGAVDNIWYFDEFHKINYNVNNEILNDTPNRLIFTESELNNNDDGLPIANYSVLETYNIKFKNSSEGTKTIEFHLDSYAGNFIYLKGLRKTPDDLPIILGKSEAAGDNLLYYIVLEPDEEIEYQMKIVLSTANDGSAKNYFKVCEGVMTYESEEIVSNLPDDNGIVELY